MQGQGYKTTWMCPQNFVHVFFSFAAQILSNIEDDAKPAELQFDQKKTWVFNVHMCSH